MKKLQTKNLLNAQFVDGDTSMHVTVTEFLGGATVVYRVSSSNTIRNEGYKVESFNDRAIALIRGGTLREQMYADMSGYLQVSM